MKFPLVVLTRSKYEAILNIVRRLNEDYIKSQLEVEKLRKENETIIGRAAQLADIERQDREREREHVAAIFANRGEQ
jgi:hypothetical protein